MHLESPLRVGFFLRARTTLGRILHGNLCNNWAY